MSLASGTRLGPYEILAPLGAGGMGEVYRARDTTLDRDVAVKVLPEALASDAEALARFEREALAAASCRIQTSSPYSASASKTAPPTPSWSSCPARPCAIGLPTGPSRRRRPSRSRSRPPEASRPWALALAPANLELRERKAMVFLAQGDLDGAKAVLKATPKEVDPTALVAYIAQYFDLVWVLEREQQELLLRLTPAAFDDKGNWAICRTSVLPAWKHSEST